MKPKREREREKRSRASRICNEFSLAETKNHKEEPFPVVDFYDGGEEYDDGDGDIFEHREHEKRGKGKLLNYSDVSSSDDYSYGGVESYELNRSKEIYQREFNRMKNVLREGDCYETVEKKEARKKKEMKREKKRKKDEGEQGPLPFDHRDLLWHQSNEGQVMENVLMMKTEEILDNNGTSSQKIAKERILPGNSGKGSSPEVEEDDIVINIVQPIKKQGIISCSHEKRSNDEIEEDDMVINIVPPVRKKGTLSSDCEKRLFDGIEEVQPVNNCMVVESFVSKMEDLDQNWNASSQHILDLQNGRTVVEQPREGKKKKKEKRETEDKEASGGKEEPKPQYTEKLEKEKKEKREKKEKVRKHEMEPDFAQELEKGKREKKEKKEKKGKREKEDNEEMKAQFMQNVGDEKKEKKRKKEAKSQLTQEADKDISDDSELLGSTKGSPSRPTISIAIAGSVVDNAQSLELATILAGQIARAAAVFRVDEIVVFDDYDGANTQDTEENDHLGGGRFMVKILEYLEVPQYLRRALIPMHRSLSSVGKLPPLDAPHHLRKYERRPFREGVVVGDVASPGSGSYVDVGLDKEVQVAQSLKTGTRVTVFMGEPMNTGDVLQVVDRETVRRAGHYWGYTVRYASCLSAVFDECSFQNKYDYCIGTSEHGKQVRPSDLLIPKCRHLLIAFGGLSGLEKSVELDQKIKAQSMTKLFDQYLNTCPNQGSRTIRTEEAILISLQFLQEAIQDAMQRP